MSDPRLAQLLNEHKDKDQLVEDPDGMITITAYVIGALVALCAAAWCLGISVH